MFENRVLRNIHVSGPERDEVTGECSRVNNVALQDMYCSPNIICTAHRILSVLPTEYYLYCSPNIICTAHQILSVLPTKYYLYCSPNIICTAHQIISVLLTKYYLYCSPNIICTAHQILSVLLTKYYPCDQMEQVARVGRQNSIIQGSGGKTRGKENTWNT